MKTSTKNRIKAKERIVLVGVPASPGYAMGLCHTVSTREVSITEENIPEERVATEEQYFLKILNTTTKEINQIKQVTVEKLGTEEARIFEAHLMILKDPTLVNGVLSLIQKEKKSAQWAVHFYVSSLIKQFESHTSALMKERSIDLKDLYHRLMDAFDDTGTVIIDESIKEGVILVAHELNPSTLISLNKDQVLAFATDSGGRTSHVSILARSMELPAVSGLKNVSALVRLGDNLIVDGTGGMIIINPNEADIKKYQEKLEVFKRQQRELFTMRQLEPITRDGKYVTLHANIELVSETDKVLDYGATGVGLYRSEFLFFRKGLPSFEEQVEAYSYILDNLAPHAVTIRTLDVGGDKLISEISLSNEANPFMGWRSIRVCLDHLELFRTQLKALLVANKKGNLRLLLPMISSMEELLSSKEQVKNVIHELEQEGFDCPKVELGVMIEVPAAVILADKLAKEVDFFSIGSNDLIQFTLAVDRTNEKISSMFQPHHPAVLNMIHKTVTAAHREGIPVSVCGEMASDPLSSLLLVGLGVDELSMTPWSIMECKKIIRSINFEEVREIARNVLKMNDTDTINAYLKKKYAQTIIDLGIFSYISNSDFCEISDSPLQQL
ncbi:MAG: phosphoenolpyruvate--protein phosphotransferase [Fibrobacter sp.]|nr:phosphoenolpyruvate--protein phosphotransferase [Fibrobacter sp.]